MGKYKNQGSFEAFVLVLIYVVISELCKWDITRSLAILVAFYVVQNKILLCRFLDAYNNDEENEEEKK